MELELRLGGGKEGLGKNERGKEVPVHSISELADLRRKWQRPKGELKLLTFGGWTFLIEGIRVGAEGGGGEEGSTWKGV